ncbi:hypothetical protein GW17_00040413 [Ensete ventricosum]|nr:hypothetical protein GW17_00040413 [Ensete ventricosum]
MTGGGVHCSVLFCFMLCSTRIVPNEDPTDIDSVTHPRSHMVAAAEVQPNPSLLWIRCNLHRKQLHPIPALHSKPVLPRLPTSSRAHLRIHRWS